MDKIDRDQFIKSRNRRVFPSKRNEGTSSEREIEVDTNIRVHNGSEGKLFTKEFLDKYIRGIIVRTIIAVAIFLCFQVWEISKIKIGKADVDGVRAVINYNYTWEIMKETVNKINYEKIVEVWNQQGE